MHTTPAVPAFGGKADPKRSRRGQAPRPSTWRYPQLALWAMVLALMVGLAPAGGTNGPPPAPVVQPPPADLGLPPGPSPTVRDQRDTGPTDWFTAWKQLKKDIETTTGTTFSLCLDDTQMFVLNGPGEGHERNLFWWNLSVTQKLWPDAKLVARIRGSSDTRHGNPPHGLYPVVRSKMNLDWRWAETEWIYLANLYLEQKLLDKKLTLTLGKINGPPMFDNNKVASWDFLSHSIAKNQIFPFKYHTIGAVVRYDAADWVYVQVGAMDAQGIRSETGLNTAFHDEDYFISMYEVGLKTGFWGKEGNYRFTFCHDPTRASRHDGRGTKNDNLAFGVSFDQMLTDKIGASFRYGVTDGDVRTFSNTWSLGCTVKGLLPSRPKDILGVGFCQGITDSSYRDRYNASAQESIFETYYKIQVTDWCWIYPDVQVVLNPGTNAHNDVSVIAGLRLKMEF